ncbi:MAG: hypothetical protein K1X74_12650 [Pirellulales bacterium]|nr:hypothetical protein [Pirellulales bacterium]
MPTMLEATGPLANLLKRDKRYKVDAYVFVFEALSFAQQVLGMGTEKASEPLDPEEPEEESSGGERHLTGQQLCEAIRMYALQQYGYLAKCVLESWGVSNTGDFGEIVFNLIRIKQMRKTPEDRREDFDNVYDFETAFKQSYEIEIPPVSK